MTNRRLAFQQQGITRIVRAKARSRKAWGPFNRTAAFGHYAAKSIRGFKLMLLGMETQRHICLVLSSVNRHE